MALGPGHTEAGDRPGGGEPSDQTPQREGLGRGASRPSQHPALQPLRAPQARSQEGVLAAHCDPRHDPTMTPEGETTENALPEVEVAPPVAAADHPFAAELDAERSGWYALIRGVRLLAPAERLRPRRHTQTPR